MVKDSESMSRKIVLLRAVTLIDLETRSTIITRDGNGNVLQQPFSRAYDLQVYLFLFHFVHHLLATLPKRCLDPSRSVGNACRQVPALPQPPQPPCNIAAMQAEVGIVQSRSLERSHSVQKLEYVQVQTAALSIKSHGKSRKCMWKHHWNKMKLDFGMFAYLHTLIHIALKTQKWFAWKTTECVSLLCLQSGKTIWANMFSMCRIHITSNCCRHWPGSRETWRSPQLLQYSLRHFDLSQKQELLRLLSVLFHCFCVEATNCSCRVWYVLTLPRSSWWCSDSRGFLLGIGCVATLLEGLHCNE